MATIPNDIPLGRISPMDRSILRALQRDGRITNAALADKVHLSPAACLERVRRLKDDGYIRGYRALLAPEMLDRALLIYVEVTLDRVTREGFDDFATAVRRIPEILECHMVAGGFDYLIKARVRDMDAYRNFLGETLLKIPGIRGTHTYVVMEEVKDTNELPV
jgi:Lrp/AsnC family transcriptional regulator, leucine-responsive regulatory protein